MQNFYSKYEMSEIDEGLTPSLPIFHEVAENNRVRRGVCSINCIVIRL